MLRNIVTLLVSVLLFKTQQAQSYPQLRFKIGPSLLFPSSSARGYAFKSMPGTGSALLLGGEYGHPFKNRKGAWHVGFTIQDYGIDPAPNEKNLVPGNLTSKGFFFLSAPTKTTVYAGIEKYINRDYSKPSKNYFSVIGGAGFSFTLNKVSDWELTVPERYVTRNGGIVEEYTSSYQRARFPFAPSLYGGLRYNITNRKGNEVLIIELLASYTFTPFYRQTIDYTLDGVARQDRLRERGFCGQLNLIVPLHSFYKKRVKKIAPHPQLMQ